MKNRVVEVATSIATAFRAIANVEYRMECPSVYNDVKLYNQINKINNNNLTKFHISTNI